jgi:RNase P subunit RPR2
MNNLTCPRCDIEELTLSYVSEKDDGNSVVVVKCSECNYIMGHFEEIYPYPAGTENE